MARRRSYRNSYTAGEVGPEFLQRTEDELLNEAASRLLNTLISNGGGAHRRPASRPVASTSGTKRQLEVFDLDDSDYRRIVFSAGKVEIFDASSLLQTLSGPWVEADIEKITVANGDDKFFIFGDFETQELAYSAGVFSIGAITFDDGIGSAVRQPYWRYAAKGVTLQPSATTGSITLVASENVFVSGHVGTRFRYLNNEIEIDTVVDGKNATGTVITTLYPTITLTVNSTAPFKVGHIVLGDTTSIEGQVAAVGSGTIDVTLRAGYTSFDSSEDISSPEGTATITAVGSTSPASTTIWDEQMISAVRGYPSTGALHRNRLIMGGFPGARNAVAASAVGFLTDFDVGTGDDNDAFIEALGDDPNAAIRHIIGAEQLILLTDRSCYYVPESEQAPLSPSRVQFLRISPDGSKTVRPVLTPEGVVFTDNANRLLIIGATGSVRASWSVSELSLLARHRITDPVQLVYVDGLGARSERYLIIRNSDGSVVVMNYRRGADQMGATPWEPAPGTEWQSFAAWKTELFCVQDGFLCDVDMDAIMDVQCDYSASCPLLAGRSVYVMRGQHVWQGPLIVDGSGNVPGIDPAEGLAIGSDFEVEITPAPPVHKHIGQERRRITRVMVDVLDTGMFRVDGELRVGGDGATDMGAEPPLMTGGLEPFYIWGYDFNHIPSITQSVGEGAPLFLRSQTLEVSY